MASQYSREVAHRVFAQEFRDSDLSFKDSNDQYSPQYLLTPTGAKINRIFIVGTLTEKEDIGTDAEYWRARVVDPTGAFIIYAGQYQPEAARTIAEMEAPAYIAIVGKPSTFQTEDGTILTSVRPESVHVVDEATRERWVVETTQRTMERINNLNSNNPNAVKAMEHYNTDVSVYKQMLVDALKESTQD
ncbi:MAG: DNA-binding protein [Methanosarcinales archaeon]|nr:DNA-binding protein [Methanosarcinales archaeon]